MITQEGFSLFDFAPQQSRLKIHDTFRYPAKFHPPVAHELIRRFSDRGETVLDPFCGSGTLLVEGIRQGRNAIGSDVDPLAVFVSDAKTRVYDSNQLKSDLAVIESRFALWDRGPDTYQHLMFNDIPEGDFESEVGALWIPAIPRLSHWFRRYVTVDLARILSEIESIESENSRTFFKLVFSSIIRNVSNADPVPVSGLEVTSHMRRRDEAGRLVDPFAAFRAKAKRTLSAVSEFESAPDDGTSTVFKHDARQPFGIDQVDAILTSPPYQSAVDYYRRHQLEMYWLGFTATHTERLEILPAYVGRANTPAAHPDLAVSWSPSQVVRDWQTAIEKTSERRARDFHAYFAAMTRIFQNLGSVLRLGGSFVVVVGRSKWGDVTIPTELMFKELMPPTLSLEDHLVYPIKNRTMSYSRHNGADINEEHVLVFSKSKEPN